jgi:hypothetical protein
MQAGVDQVVLGGLHVVRGDNMCAIILMSIPELNVECLPRVKYFSSCSKTGSHARLTLCNLVCRAVVGEIDEEIDRSVDLSAIRAIPLSPVQH